jgi:hypothetical protein
MTDSGADPPVDAPERAHSLRPDSLPATAPGLTLARGSA